MKEKKQLDYISVLLDDPLYYEYNLNEFEIESLMNLLYYHPNKSINKSKSIDSYCPFCEKETTFISRISDEQELVNMLIATNDNSPGNPTSSNFYKERRPFRPFENIGIFTRTFYCPRHTDDHSHEHIYIIRVANGKLSKIGQTPSIADLSNVKIEKYRKFNVEIYRELNRAIGLASYGIGVGSFVYLRRIIENHIVQPKLKNLETRKIVGLDFKKKIQMVKNDLPKFLTDNSKIYSILSKGIHELTENDCKAYFPILKTAIELILDEQIEQQEIEKKKAEIRKQLGKIN